MAFAAAALPVQHFYFLEPRQVKPPPYVRKCALEEPSLHLEKGTDQHKLCMCKHECEHTSHRGLERPDPLGYYNHGCQMHNDICPCGEHQCAYRQTCPCQYECPYRHRKEWQIRCKGYQRQKVYDISRNSRVVLARGKIYYLSSFLTL